MQVGDLVRNSFNREIGVIIGEAKVNGPCPVWQVVAVNGKLRKWQRFQMVYHSQPYLP